MSQDITKEDLNIGKIIFEWKVKEYDRADHDRSWYIMMGVIAAVLIIYAIIAANYLFALLIALFGIILFMHDILEPLEVTFAVTEIGIILGRKFYRYSELESFWMIYDPPMVKSLYFGLDGIIRHRLYVPLLDNDPRPIRDYLNQFVEEDLDQEEEPTSEKISRMFQI